jgi:hypothetical protein
VREPVVTTALVVPELEKPVQQAFGFLKLSVYLMIIPDKA